MIAATILDNILDHSEQWEEAQLASDETLDSLDDIRSRVLALSEAQQATVNELATGITTLSGNLATVLAASKAVSEQLAIVTSEEASEEQRRIAAEAALAQNQSDVIDALTPLTLQVNAMNSSLTTPSSAGGGALDPT